MSDFTYRLDPGTVDYYIRKAHAERADAFAAVFSAAGRQIKGLFSSPESATGCGPRISRA